MLEITPKDSVGKINQALWGPLSETIVTANEDGSIRVYDGEVRRGNRSSRGVMAALTTAMQTGKPLQEVREHKKSINSFSFSKDRSHFITGAMRRRSAPAGRPHARRPLSAASADSTAKLFDTTTLKVLKVFEAEKSVNAAAISPLMPHVRGVVASPRRPA